MKKTLCNYFIGLLVAFTFSCGKKSKDPSPADDPVVAGTFIYEGELYTMESTKDSTWNGVFTQRAQPTPHWGLQLVFDQKPLRDTVLDLSKQDFLIVYFDAPDTYQMYGSSGTVDVKVRKGYITSTCTSCEIYRYTDKNYTRPISFEVTTK
ncbi:hypothetical protein [Sporocytophaga myxococcoides]|uniref:hypothetical protein n=1 Tax=Sporocytophaga myxococcoides TaxID=153721 RepID=UPI000417AF61|nr:hypothetical protein [Sporocytophaga myxococcoides]